MPEEFLPKPPTDLPLPEKEITAHAGENTGRKFPFPKYIFLGIVFVVLMGLIAGAYFLGKNNSSKQVSNIGVEVNSPTTTNPEKQNSNGSFPYLRGNEIYIEKSKATNTNNSVYKYVYSENNQMLAYILGKRITREDDGYSYLIPQEVYIQKIGQTPKKIFELTPVQDINSDYSLQIKDIGYSLDGNILAVTTSQNLSIYDQNGTLINSIDLPKNGDDGYGLVYFYGNPKFSPDNTKILLTKGYYEGRSDSLVDLKTKKVTGLGNTAYTSGSYYVGWLPNSKMLIYEYGDTTSEDPTKSSFIITSQDNIKEKTFPINMDTRDQILNGTKLFAIANEKLIEFDTSTGSQKTIASLPNLKDYYAQSMAFSKKLNKIFISIHKPITGDEKDAVYVLDLSNSNPEFTLYEDEASLFIEQ